MLGNALRLLAGCLMVAGQMEALEIGKPLEQFAHQTWRTENGLPQNTVHAILQTRDGYLWLGTEGGLVRFDGLRFAVFDRQNTPVLASNNMQALAEDASGHLLVTTVKGSYAYSSGRFTKVANAAPGSASSGASEALLTMKSGLPRNRITAAYQDQEGSIWLGTDAGAARLANGRLERFPATTELANEAILCFYEDREGDLWVGTEAGGVTELRDQKFTTYVGTDGVPEGAVRCVFEDRAGAVWMGTSEEGLRRFAGGHFSAMGTRDGLLSNSVFALNADGEGRLLVGTPDGLSRVRDGAAMAPVTSADGLPDDFVRSLFEDRDGSVWIGTRRGLSHLKGNEVKTYSTRDGLGSDLVGALLRDRAGDFWAATLHGLSRLKEGRITNFTTLDGLSSDVITALEQTSSGNLWIGTEDGGIDLFRNGRFTHGAAGAGLPQVVYGMVEDGHQNLWIASNAGIFRVNEPELARWMDARGGAPLVVSYGASDGMRISECSGGGHPAVLKARDGALWFATPKGVAVLRPEDAGLDRVPPPVVIESVSVDEEAINPATFSTVRPGHERISFEYAGLSFVAPQKVQFRYRLEGFDQGWIEAGTRRVAYYTNLAPGRYRFRVQARNGDGISSEGGASLGFEWQPHYYQTIWFKALLVAALLLATYGVYRLRVRAVEGRFQAVLAERNRIAREIHDTLAQGFMGVSVQLEIVARLLSSSSEAAREHLDVARTQVRSSIAEARQAIWALRSQQTLQATGNEDLAARFSRMVQQATQTVPAKVRFAVHGAYRPLGGKVEDQLLRIGQEAVTNAARHAEAQNITIELTFTQKKVRMRIADDGRGFQVLPNGKGPEGHFGLAGMRERAAQIPAKISVTSAPGEGTSVEVEAPVN